jgi:hypothetical protein
MKNLLKQNSNILVPGIQKMIFFFSLGQILFILSPLSLTKN